MYVPFTLHQICTVIKLLCSYIRVHVHVCSIQFCIVHVYISIECLLSVSIILYGLPLQWGSQNMWQCPNFCQSALHDVTHTSRYDSVCSLTLMGSVRSIYIHVHVHLLAINDPYFLPEFNQIFVTHTVEMTVYIHLH